MSDECIIQIINQIIKVSKNKKMITALESLNELCNESTDELIGFHWETLVDIISEFITCPLTDEWICILHIVKIVPTLNPEI